MSVDCTVKRQPEAKKEERLGKGRHAIVVDGVQWHLARRARLPELTRHRWQGSWELPPGLVWVAKCQHTPKRQPGHPTREWSREAQHEQERKEKGIRTVGKQPKEECLVLKGCPTGLLGPGVPISRATEECQLDGMEVSGHGCHVETSGGENHCDASSLVRDEAKENPQETWTPSSDHS